jgi:hypothetical protein
LREVIRPAIVVPGVERAPSVIESLNATMALAASLVSTSSRESRNQLWIVPTVASVAFPTWLPVSEI